MEEGIGKIIVPMAIDIESLFLKGKEMDEYERDYEVLHL